MVRKNGRKVEYKPCVIMKCYVMKEIMRHTCQQKVERILNGIMLVRFLVVVNRRQVRVVGCYKNVILFQILCFICGIEIGSRSVTILDQERWYELCGLQYLCVTIKYGSFVCYLIFVNSGRQRKDSGIERLIWYVELVERKKGIGY